MHINGKFAKCVRYLCSFGNGQLPYRRSTLPLLLLLKKVGSERLRESDIYPISPKTPAPQYQPIDGKKRKGKIAEDHSRDRTAKVNKKSLALLLKNATPTPSNMGLANHSRRTREGNKSPAVLRGSAAR